MYNLGLQYRYGKGVVQSTQGYVQAKSWFEKAATAGDLDVMIQLGDLYRDGLGVTKSVADALTWYQKAAAAGNADAKNCLAALPSN